MSEFFRYDDPHALYSLCKSVVKIYEDHKFLDYSFSHSIENYMIKKIKNNRAYYSKEFEEFLKEDALYNFLEKYVDKAKKEYRRALKKFKKEYKKALFFNKVNENLYKFFDDKIDIEKRYTKVLNIAKQWYMFAEPFIGDENKIREEISLLIKKLLYLIDKRYVYKEIEKEKRERLFFYLLGIRGEEKREKFKSIYNKLYKRYEMCKPENLPERKIEVIEYLLDVYKKEILPAYGVPKKKIEKITSLSELIARVQKEKMKREKKVKTLIENILNKFQENEKLVEEYVIEIVDGKIIPIHLKRFMKTLSPSKEYYEKIFSKFKSESGKIPLSTPIGITIAYQELSRKPHKYKETKKEREELFFYLLGMREKEKIEKFKKTYTKWSKRYKKCILKNLPKRKIEVIEYLLDVYKKEILPAYNIPEEKIEEITSLSELLARIYKEKMEREKKTRLYIEKLQNKLKNDEELKEKYIFEDADGEKIPISSSIFVETLSRSKKHYEKVFSELRNKLGKIPLSTPISIVQIYERLPKRKRFKQYK